MQTITLQPLLHRGAEQIGIVCQRTPAINNLLKKVEDIRWSQSHRCWYLPQNEEAYLRLRKSIKEGFGATVIIDAGELMQYLLKKKKLLSLQSKTAAMPVLKASQLKIIEAVSAGNMQQLEAFTQMLTLKAYSASTAKTYRNEFLQLLQIIKAKPVEDLTVTDIKRYMAYAMKEQGISENTAHSRLNALKFYYEQVLRREKFFWEIPRPKKPLQLPKLLNEAELAKLFNALTNKKHKAMLFTAYSAGLRVSEIVNLKIADIDSGRMQIRIANAKGKKDRYVNLSPVLLDILRKYISHYKPAPKVYLFESGDSLWAYPTRTVQQIFSKAKNKAGIIKEVGIHSLRHSFATHLLDKGTDIKYIKDLLGHFNIKTTERYLHVSKQQLVNIVSPLDDLMGKETIDW